MTGRTAVLAILALGAVPPLQASGATIQPDPPHVIKVQMKDEGGGQWRFEPAEIEAHPGDTVRFIQTDIVPHNVQFKSEPKGAKLGSAQMGPFLLKKGDTYDLVIDDRFVPGTYHFACTPHEMLGMKGTLQVDSAGTSEDASPHPVPPSSGGHP